MKRINFCLIIMLTCSGLFAQNQKGYMIVGVNLASAGFSSGKSESSYSLSPTISRSENNYFNISVNPNIGFYISDKTVVGGLISVSYNTNKSDNSNSSTSNTSTSKSSYATVGFGPYARFYLGDPKAKALPFLQPMAGIYFYPGYKYTYTSSSGNANTTEYEGYTPWTLGLQLGYEQFLNNVIGLQFTVGYNYWNYDYDYNVKYTSGPGTNYTGHYESHSNDISIGVGLAVHLASLKKK